MAEGTSQLGNRFLEVQHQNDKHWIPKSQRPIACIQCAEKTRNVERLGSAVENQAFRKITIPRIPHTETWIILGMRSGCGKTMPATPIKPRERSSKESHAWLWASNRTCHAKSPSANPRELFMSALRPDAARPGSPEVDRCATLSFFWANDRIGPNRGSGHTSFPVTSPINAGYW